LKVPGGIRCKGQVQGIIHDRPRRYSMIVRWVCEEGMIDPGGIQREDAERKEWKYMRERGGIQQC
jgi:hypothetical protein